MIRSPRVTLKFSTRQHHQRATCRTRVGTNINEGKCLSRGYVAYIAHRLRTCLPGELFPMLEAVLDGVSEQLELVVSIVSLVPLGKLLNASRAGMGRPSKDRTALATAFIAKAVLGQVYSRLKDEFGANQVRVRRAAKVMAHLMFGVLALAVDQWLRGRSRGAGADRGLRGVRAGRRPPGRRALGRGRRLLRGRGSQGPRHRARPRGPRRPRPHGPHPDGLRQPTIAAVEGHAVAGGLELSLCATCAWRRNAVFGVFCRRWGVPLIDGGRCGCRS